MEVRAKKNLGQHFLRDLGVAGKIAATISQAEVGEPLGSLPVMEIGPGMGVLTRFLTEAGRNVTAVELDSESVEYLNREMPSLRVVEGDFLKMDLDTLIDGEMVLIGNYPYNISSQIFFKVLDYKDKIPLVSGMLQKEVAERICAAPGGKGVWHTVGAAAGMVRLPVSLQCAPRSVCPATEGDKRSAAPDAQFTY